MRIKASKKDPLKPASLRFKASLLDWIDEQAKVASSKTGRFISRQELITRILETAKNDSSFELNLDEE